MTIINYTKKVTSSRNMCDHIWEEQVFLTRIGAMLKTLFLRIEGERFSYNGILDNVVREHSNNR